MELKSKIKVGGKAYIRKSKTECEKVRIKEVHFTLDEMGYTTDYVLETSEGDIKAPEKRVYKDKESACSRQASARINPRKVEFDGDRYSKAIKGKNSKIYNGVTIQVSNEIGSVVKTREKLDGVLNAKILLQKVEVILAKGLRKKVYWGTILHSGNTVALIESSIYRK